MSAIVGGHFFEYRRGVGVPVGGAADVLKAVGDDEVFCFEGMIVDRRLPQGLLAHGQVGGLAFYDHPRFALAIEDHDVGTFLQPVELEAAFDADEGTRVLQGLDEVVHKMLPHPFFGCQHQIFFADAVEDQKLALLFFEDIFKIGKVELDHAHK